MVHQRAEAARAAGSAEVVVHGQVKGRARKLGFFLACLGAGGLVLNLRVYIPALRVGEISPLAYLAVAIAGLVGLWLVVVGARIMRSGEDLFPK